MADKLIERAEALGRLEDAERRLKTARADKKREMKLHNEDIGAIQDEINDILDKLAAP